MNRNKYQIVVTLPKADGVHQKGDYQLARSVEDALTEGLRDRFVEIDCTNVVEVPKPKSKADLSVGTRVLVTRFPGEGRQPYAARVAGYDLHRSKYRLDMEYAPGRYTEGGHDWVFPGQVEIHPDGGSCLPKPVISPDLFERRWNCYVVSTGYHNGAGCDPTDPHGGDWCCKYLWSAAFTDAKARELGFDVPETEETNT